jgi:hypothetical protein
MLVALPRGPSRRRSFLEAHLPFRGSRASRQRLRCLLSARRPERRLPLQHAVARPQAGSPKSKTVRATRRCSSVIAANWTTDLVNADFYGDTLGGKARQGSKTPDSMSNCHDTLRREAVWFTHKLRSGRRSEALLKSTNPPLPGNAARLGYPSTPPQQLLRPSATAAQSVRRAPSSMGVGTSP